MTTEKTPDELAREIHKRADAQKTDPGIAEGVVVPKGDEGRPGGKRNPFADRIAMFEKSDQMRRDGRPRSGTDAPVVPGGINPDDPGDAVAGAAGAPAAAVEDRTLHLKKPGESAPSHSGSEYVSLQLPEGGSITVTRSDIEAVGGEEGYLRRRRDDELDLRARTAERERDALRTQLAESDRLREELARERAGQGGPASRTVDPAEQRRNDVGNMGVGDLEERAKALAKDIYSGDQADAERAVRQILAGQQGNSLSVDEVVQRATEALRRESAQTTEAKPAAKPSPVMQAINEQINDMSRRDFADVVANPEARAAAYQRFLLEVAKPDNKDRRAVDIARESMNSIRELYKTQPHPRADVIESKRGLPVSNVASGATAPTGEEAEDSRSYIERLSESRNFSRRPK